MAPPGCSPLQVSAESLDQRVVDPAANDSERVPLQDGADLEELLDIVSRILRSDEPTRGQRLDQPFGLELVQSLTNGGPTDPQLLGEVFLRQALAGAAALRVWGGG
mgnify:CR=1 FL=1